ncbi:MAG: transporter substrate-binding domain-containing protein [Burkholderiales bacterium]|jgi:polar amino acid transport system substrate-binding protein|nr:transporter substrate-binding domain-containing protein [Burkholderiales bacterium]
MRLPTLVLLCVLSLAQPQALAQPQVQAAPAQPFLMGITAPDTSYFYKWSERIYREAFRRLGLRVEMSTYPTLRIGVLLDQGAIDGEVARARVYAEVHPELIRVEESVIDATIALYTANSSLDVTRLDDLRALKLRAGHLRGALYCERALASVLPAAQITDVTYDEQGLQMLLSGRIDAFCGVDLTVLDVLDAPELKGAAAVLRKAAVLLAAPLYPYLHGRHADLALRLAVTLKSMKAEGLIERYRPEALREVGR